MPLFKFLVKPQVRELFCATWTKTYFLEDIDRDQTAQDINSYQIYTVSLSNHAHTNTFFFLLSVSKFQLLNEGFFHVVDRVIFAQSQTTNHLHSSTLKDSADDNFKFGENGGKSSERVENAVRKGKTDCNKQFSFSNRVFKRLVMQSGKRHRLVWERVKYCTRQMSCFQIQGIIQTAFFQNIVHLFKSAFEK